jgi:hypothetical protein
MAQSFSHSYKKYVRGTRQVLPEQIFNMGMVYTDNPIGEGQTRLLVNMTLADQGRRIRPRGGFKPLWTVPFDNSGKKQFIHHTGSLFVKVGEDAIYRRYVLVGPKDTPGTGMTFSEMSLLVENPDTEQLVESALTDYAGIHVVKFKSTTDWNQIHGVQIKDPHPDGIFATVEGNTYLLTQLGMARLIVEAVGNGYKHRLETVAARAVTATEAVNYGYNMLSETPYTFLSQQGPILRLDGILPYIPGKNTLMLNAKVGEIVRFKLNYQYPSGSPTYKVEWKVQDITRSDAPTTIQTLAQSAVYTAGQDIYIDYAPPYKRASIICTVYASADLATPLKSIVLAAYNLADDTNAQNKNLEPKIFSLKTADDMCTWNGHTAVWGVSGANMTLFLSDINDPSYFPFPNNVSIFDEEILKAVPLMSDLLIVTETKMHLLSLDPINGYTSKVVQDSLRFSKADANTVVVVKNMVFFKSAEYYYMVVPRKEDPSGALQVAPVSKPITYLIDNFEKEIRRIVDNVYALDFTLKVPKEDIGLELQSFHNYLDNAAIHNVYKYKVTFLTSEVYIDIVLSYDTMLRAWTIKLYEMNSNTLVPYRKMATENARYINIFRLGNQSFMQLCKIDTEDPKDYINLDGYAARRIKNYQLIDTGKRDIAGTVKKRFREVIMEVNNISNKDLEFNDVFIIDDDQRTDLFEYNVIHITDINDPNYGTIYVERSYSDPMLVVGPTTLGTWKLDMSGFPEQTIVKVRLECTGKGYYPRLRLISRNEVMYEVNNISWVFRDLYAR